MHLTILYPLKELVLLDNKTVNVTRYHMLTGVSSTFPIQQTDVTILTTSQTSFHDVLHTQTPHCYKSFPHNVWPFNEDCLIVNEFLKLDLQINYVKALPFEYDRSQHNINTLKDFVDTNYVFHDDLSYIDTMIHNRCNYSAIEKRINRFSAFLNTNFNIQIKDTNFVIESC